MLAVDHNIDFDFRPKRSGALGRDRDPTMFRRLIVAKNARGPVKIDEDEIRVAIVVEVPRRKRATARGFREVAERRLGRFHEERHRVATAVHEELAALRVGLARRDARDVRLEMAVGLHDVLVAVEVEICEEEPEGEIAPRGRAETLAE